MALGSMKKNNFKLLFAAVAVVAAVCVLAAPGAQAQKTKASERLELGREIPTHHFVLLDEGRLAASSWAAYVYRKPVGGSESVPCAYIGAIDFISPEVGFFKYAGECGEIWPGEGAGRPALAFIRQRTYYHGRNRSEGMGVVLVAPTVRSVRLRFRGSLPVWARVSALSRRDSAKARVPVLRYATFAVHLNRCIRSISAYGAGSKRVGAVNYPNC
jgi:hypothetical protein